MNRAVIAIEPGARAAAVALTESAGGVIVDSSRAGRFLVVETAQRLSSWTGRVEWSPAVRYVQPDVRVTGGDIVPADPVWTSLWGMQRVNAPAAWSTTTGARDVVVGVVDSGVDYRHEDLAGSIWVNPNEDPSTPHDDDRNGWINDIHGVDCANDDGDPMDDNGHGTHVAGTIGATGNNSKGVAGVAWNVRIMALKFLGADNRGWMSDAVQCMYYALDNGAHITNHSWYGGDWFQPLYDVIAEAGKRNHLVIACAGNEGTDLDRRAFYPAAFDLDNAISVAATDRNDALASFSNRGAVSVDLGAPGVGIISTVPSGYASYSGTSMATPHVTGAAALALSQDPALHADAARLRSLLLDTVDPVSGLVGVTASEGILDVARLVAAVARETDTPPASVLDHEETRPQRRPCDRKAANTPRKQGCKRNSRTGNRR
ncbi:MAG: S8 family serine peptidase [Actinomycetota bacterium]|nr:S8 family serine peptidase [Actinomycetota bacterium]